MEVKQSTGKQKYVNRVLGRSIFRCLNNTICNSQHNVGDVIDISLRLVDNFSLTGKLDTNDVGVLTNVCASVVSRITGKNPLEAALFAISEIRRYNLDEAKKYEEKVSWKGAKLRDFIDPILRHAVPLYGDADAVDPESKLPHTYAILFYCMVLLNWEVE